jgi:putative addiction module killer protein
VHELRFTFGAGLRVYYAFENATLVLMLGGGDKSSQPRDIRKAKDLWQTYQKEKLS